MRRYLANRIAHLCAVVAGSMLVVFLVTQVIGNPAALILPLGSSPQQVDALSRQLGYNDPFWVQLGRFIGNTVRLDFGDSIWQRTPAIGIVAHALPRTLILATGAFVLAMAVGIPLGVLSAVRPRGLADRLVSGGALVLLSTADFWLAIMLIRWLSLSTGAFATSGYGLDYRHLVLPTLALAAYPLARVCGLTRAAVVEQTALPYVQTALAKGVPTGRLWFVHVLRNALLPVVTLGAYDFGIVIAGSSAVIEALFQWPGMGLLAVQALQHRDFPLIQATVFVSAVTIAVMNLLIDVVYGLVDPRVRLHRRMRTA